MATVIAVRFTGKVLVDGSSPVMLKIQKGSTKKHFSLGFSATQRQWDDENRCFVRDRRINPPTFAIDENDKRIEIEGYSVKNAFIDRKRIKAQGIIDSFDRENIDWTLAMFEDKFINETEKILVVDYLKTFIQKLKVQKKFGNANVYSRLSEILVCFEKDTNTKVSKLYFHDFGYDVVNKFYLYLTNDRKVTGNTASFYLRTLRSIMNYALKDGCGSKEGYCFSKQYSDTKKVFHIGKLKEETRKRFIPKDYLKIIKDTTFEREQLEYARHLFLLSFYMYGCSFIDMAMLKTSDIEPGVTKTGDLVEIIKYIRRKTHKEYSIQVRQEIREQLDWFKNYSTVGDFLLPCVTKNLKDEALQNHVINRRGKYGKYLKELASSLAFPEALQRISSYYSRHSYAMAMQASGKSMETIQQALGHEDLATTKVYLESFDDEFLSTESDGLI